MNQKPVIKLLMNQKRMVCLCNQVSAPEMKRILRAGAVTLAEVQQHTAAGTSCGRCIREIEAIVEKHKNEKKNDPQLRIRFE